MGAISAGQILRFNRTRPSHLTQVQQFLKAVNDSHTIYTERWGDIMWHSFALKLFLGAQREVALGYWRRQGLKICLYPSLTVLPLTCTSALASADPRRLHMFDDFAYEHATIMQLSRTQQRWIRNESSCDRKLLP